MAGLLQEKYAVYSGKYDVHGTILDYGFMIKLKFDYEDKEIEMAVSRPFPEHGEEAFKKLGEETIDTYVEKLLSGEIKVPRTMLRYWHVDKRRDEGTGEEYLLAHGNVTGHKRLVDSTFIHTSVIQEMKINGVSGELEIQTMNTKYYCPLVYCNFKRQDEYAGLIPDYGSIKKKYSNTIKTPTIEAGKVLLILSNFDEYYFNSLYYIPEGEKEPIKYTAYPHIGTFQDSFLIQDENWDKIDLRYFPHYQNIEFYAEHIGGKPLFVENIGDITLFADTSEGIIKLEPGDRKEVCKENAESDICGLPGGDLYPAGIIE